MQKVITINLNGNAYQLDEKWIELDAVVATVSANQRDRCACSRLDASDLRAERSDLVAELVKYPAVLSQPLSNFSLEIGLAFRVHGLPTRLTGPINEVRLKRP